jgi:adenylate cyclase
VDDEMAMLVNWTGRWGSCFKHIPYYYLLELQETRKQVRQRLDGILAKKGQELSVQEKGEVDYLTSSDKKLKEELAGMVKDKICIVGLTATGTQDLKPIPLQTKYPMVGMHSNMMYTIVERDFIKKVGTSLNLFLLFFTALIIGFGSLMKLSRSLALSLCYILGYFFLTLWAFDKFGLWLDLVAPVSVVVFGFSATTSFRFFTEEREKLWIKQAFSHYLSAEVINQLIEDPSKLKLGGERKILTVLFADVRGFTKFSESHQPEEVVSILNMIFSQLVKTLFKHNGTLDKFVGDQIMAFFGAPGDIHKDTHAFYAVRTAIEMQARLRGLQEELIREKKQPLQVGIGINTGEMVVGNMGSSERMDYTVIGDNVNLASRLCAAAAGDEIIIGKATYEQIKDKIKAQALAPITVKGKSEPIEIYKVIGFMEQIE